MTADRQVRDAGRQSRGRYAQFLADYFWFILKNVIGWILILSSGPIGLVFPGPGGIPIFLIGFALVTFPGKRRLTARVMYGRPLQLQARIFTGLTVLLSLAAPALMLWYLASRYRVQDDWMLAPAVLVAICVLAALATVLVTRLLLRLVNVIIRSIPRIRRRIRPWLRRRGLHLLPPRRRLASPDVGEKGDAIRFRDGPDGPSQNGSRPLFRPVSSEEEILEIDQRHHRRLQLAWDWLRPWLHRAVGVSITIAIFLWILDPIYQHWPQVRGVILGTSPVRFILAVGMFALFLFMFRVLAWRWILQGFGHRLPVGAATRIWSTSELARYLPGAIWQVVGRVYLLRPYGINAVTSSASQGLELAVFLLANLLLATFCLIWFGGEMADEARQWLYIAGALVPVLLVLLNPRVFYWLLNRILEAMKQPAMTQRLSRGLLGGVVVWTLIGLVWQSLAIWVVMSDVLELRLWHLWLVAGAYALAWSIGFLAVWVPAGFGVRELVLVTTLQFALPGVAERYAAADDQVFLALLAFVAILLRFWSMVGEILLTATAYALDYRGLLGRSGQTERPKLPHVPATEIEPEATR